MCGDEQHRASFAQVAPKYDGHAVIRGSKPRSYEHHRELYPDTRADCIIIGADEPKAETLGIVSVVIRRSTFSRNPGELAETRFPIEGKKKRMPKQEDRKPRRQFV